jgi:predicted CXXCH cytochrome family protein
MVTRIRNKQNFFIFVTLLFIFLLLSLKPIDLYSSSLYPHSDKSKLPGGCMSCHMGHGMRNTAMLPKDGPNLCYRCHGDTADIARAKQRRALAAHVTLKDIRREFNKPYHHPVEKTGIHRYGEILPETDSSMPRHSECVDCHNYHYARKGNTMVAIKGTTRQGLKTESVSNEYELCFNCHSSSANLPVDQTNKAELFNTTNPSYHPVIGAGKNHDVPSLIPSLTTSSIIKCTDCHNNDDPLGPKGPHGSIYEHILKKNFVSTDGPEEASKYDLCYSCHRRESILSSVSFPLHNLHISIVGTSCRTCHNPHGSTKYPHLIDFNSISVSPSDSGRLAYVSQGNRAGQCYLTCHGQNHDPASYPASNSQTTQPTTSAIKSKKITPSLLDKLLNP